VVLVVHREAQAQTGLVLFLAQLVQLAVGLVVGI
jgi:hypothetical protein